MDHTDHPNLIVIHNYPTRPEADLAIAALEAAGIPAMIHADTAGGMREHLAWSTKGFRILIRKDDAPTAREVLTPTSDSPEPDTPRVPDAGRLAGCPTSPCEGGS